MQPQSGSLDSTASAALQKISASVEKFQEDPKKKGARTSALKGIEKQVSIIGEEILKEQKVLEKSVEKMLHGKTPSHDFQKISLDIEGQREKLAHLKQQLAPLVGSKKAQKLWDSIISKEASLAELKGSADFVNRAAEAKIPRANELYLEIQGILVKARKGSRERSGERLNEAIKKYQEIKGIKDGLPLGDSNRGLLEKDLETLEIEMTKVAEEKLPLSQKEISFYENYTAKPSKFMDRVFSKGYHEKMRLLVFRVGVAKTYFEPKGVGGFDTKLGSTRGLTIKSDIARSKKGAKPQFQPSIQGVDSRRISSMNEQALEAYSLRRHPFKATPAPMQNRNIAKIAKSVDGIRREQMNTLAELKNVQKKYREGSYKLVDLENDIQKLARLIQETEENLNKLEEEAASKGPRKSVHKVVKAVGENRVLLSALKRKKVELAIINEPNFTTASELLSHINAKVNEAVKNPDDAGFLLFEAFENLEELNELKASGVNKEALNEEIDRMKSEADAIIHSVAALKTLELTKSTNKLDFALRYTDDPNQEKKILSSKSIEKNIKFILSKKITRALLAEQNTDLIIEIDEILAFLEKNDLNLYAKLALSENLGPLLHLHGQRISDTNRDKAATLRLEVREIIAGISKKDKNSDPALKLFKAFQKQEEIQVLVDKEFDPKKKAALESILNDVKEYIKNKGEKSLRLTSHKKELRKKLLKNKGLSKKYKDHQVKRVLANDMMLRLLGLGSEKLDGEIEKIFDNLKVANNEIFEKLRKDDNLMSLTTRYAEELVSSPKSQKAVRSSSFVSVNKNLITNDMSNKELRLLFKTGEEFLNTEKKHNQDMKNISKILQGDRSISFLLRNEIALLNDHIEANNSFLEKLQSVITKNTIDSQGLAELFESLEFEENIQSIENYTLIFSDFQSKIAQEGITVLISNLLSKRGENIDIQAEIIKPVQRGPRYKLLCSELSKHSEGLADQSHKTNFIKALNSVQSLMAGVNQRLSKT